MATEEACPECGNQLDQRGLCPACDSATPRQKKSRSQIRDGDGAPDMSDVVQVPKSPSGGPRNRPQFNLPPDFVLSPDRESGQKAEAEEEPGPSIDPIDPTKNNGSAPAPATDQPVEDAFRQLEGGTVRKPEEKKGMETDIQPRPTTPGGALARLKLLAAQTREKKARRIALSTELSNIIIILVDELIPACKEGDLDLTEVDSQTRSDNPKSGPFLDLYAAAVQDEDAELRADYEKIVALARRMDGDNGKELTDLLREVDLEKMSTKALQAYKARVAEAAKAEARARQEREAEEKLATSQARQKNQEELGSMATHESIVDALEALQRGEKPCVALHLGQKAPVPLEQYRDGRWHKEPLGTGIASIVFELSLAEGEGKYTARIIAEGENARGVRFMDLSDPEIGEPGVFAFDKDFSSLNDTRMDPFDCCRFAFRGWIRGDKIRREEHDILQGYRDGVTPNASAREFVVNGSEGSLYVPPTTFAITVTTTDKTGRKHQDQLEVEFEGILTRDESGGPVIVANQHLKMLAPYGQTPNMKALYDAQILVSVFTEPVTQGGKPVLNPDNTPRMGTMVSCEPFGLRKAVVNAPNEQRDRLVKLLETQQQIQVARENLHEFVNNADPATLGKVVWIAVNYNTVPEDRVEQVKSMAQAMYPCSILGKALWSAFRDEILNPAAVPETFQAVNPEVAPDNAAEATPVAEATQSPDAPATEQANPVAAA